MHDHAIHVGWGWIAALYVLGVGLLCCWMWRSVKRDEPQYPRYTEED